jgi:hypothetical protein
LASDNKCTVKINSVEKELLLNTTFIQAPAKMNDDRYEWFLEKATEVEFMKSLIYVIDQNESNQQRPF